MSDPKRSNEIARKAAVVPSGYRNWHAWLTNPPNGRTEFTLYSDAWFTAELDDVGPYTFINTVAGAEPTVGVAAPAVVLRADFALDQDMDARLPLGEDRVEAHHGGWIDEELAALLSLALGARCRSGGPTRWWREHDELGTPMLGEHAIPYLPPPDRRYRRRSILEDPSEAVDLQDAATLLNLYPNVPWKSAGSLVRAARQYQQALWGADGDANLSWLQLVAALEAAANALARPIPKPKPADEVRRSWKELAVVLDSADPPPSKALWGDLYRLTRASAKVRRLIELYPPPPPNKRPEHGRIDWTPQNVLDLVMKVYDLRSDALHRGVPMPGPMCTPAMRLDDDVPVEGSISSGYGSGEGTWKGSSIPMHLHVFAHVVGEVLRAWWKDLAIQGDA